MADWLSGPKFLAWLEETDDFKGWVHGEGWKKRAQRWREGESVSVWRADAVLTMIGFHLSMVPDEIWLDHSPNRKPEGRPNFSPEVREQVIHEREDGATVGALSAAHGVSERTIREWTRKSKQRAAR